MLRRPLLTFLLSLLAWPQGAPPTLSVRSDLVTLAVTVADGRGQPVDGLHAEQFTVFDGGTPRPIEFFSGDAMAASIGLLLDASGSMRGLRPGIVAAAAAFAQTRLPDDEYFVLHFNEALWPGLPEGMPFTSDAAVLVNAIGAYPARGTTALYDAVIFGLAHLDTGARDRKALIVVSDGGDNASVHTLQDAVAQARRAAVTIYGISLLDRDSADARPKVLKALAEDTGGRLFTIERPDQAIAAFVAIAREIRSAYAIGFVPLDAPPGFHAIRVTVGAAGGHLVARTRAGYYAGPLR
jgi:VWFA-related protein